MHLQLNEIISIAEHTIQAQTHANIYLNPYNAIVHPSPPSLPPPTTSLPPIPFPIHHAFGGALTLSGTSGFTSVTTLNNSSTTLSPVLPPASLIFFNCSSASLSASSSAFLLPLVCYKSQKKFGINQFMFSLSHLYVDM